MEGAGMDKAERQYLGANQVIRNLADHLEAGRAEEAADLYSHCQEDVGYLLMARVSKDRAVQARMAKMFFMAKDYEKAALVMEANDEHKRAAELYERTDMYDHAAEMYLKIGDAGKAAHMYEKYGDWQSAADLFTKAGNFEKAAYCFEKAVNHFLAGKYYFQLQKYQKSMELLQKVRKEEESYLEAAIMIGNILALNGYLDTAVAKYRSVTATLPIGEGSLSVYYNLAQLLERKGDIFEAMKVYKDVGAVQPGYRDVDERIGKLEAEMASKVEAPAGGELEEAELVNSLQPPTEEITVPGGPHPLAVSAPARIVSVMEGFEFLRNTSLFEGLSLGEMKALWTICAVREFAAGAMLIEQYTPGLALFIVKRGAVVVQRVDGHSVVDLVQLGPGNHVGEMSLVDNANTSARVIAGDGGAEVFEISRDKFDELMESDDKIAIKIFKVFIATLCERLRKTTAELSALKAGQGR